MIEDPQMWVDTIIEAFDGMRGLRRCINWISTLFASTQVMNIKEVFQKVLDHQKAYLTPGHMLHSSKEDIKNYVLERMEWVFRIQGVPHEDGMTCCEWLGLDPPANFHVNLQDEIEAIFCCCMKKLLLFLRLFTMPETFSHAIWQMTRMTMTAETTLAHQHRASTAHMM